MRKVSLFLTILSLCLISNAQKIGEWTTHTPGMNVISVDMMHNKVFAATPYDIFYYNLDDNSINHLSKVNGLSDMGINIIKYSESADKLFVGYSNTNIDIIDNQGNVINIPDIYNKYILGNKTINDVFFNEQYAYVCCGFGVVVVDLQRYEINDTYFFSIDNNYLGVNDFTLFNGIFYAATENGIYYAEKDNSHLADFSQWRKFRHDLPYTDENFSQMENFNGSVIIVHSDNEHDNDEFYAIYDTTSWGGYLEYPQRVVSNLRAYDDRIVMTEKGKRIKAFDKDANRIIMIEDLYANSTFYDITRNCYWIGSKVYSLVKAYRTTKYSIIPFNGPYSSNAFKLNAVGTDLWVAAGGYLATWAKTYNHEGFSHYDGDTWEYFNEKTDKNAFSYVNQSTGDTILLTDIVSVKQDPVDSDIVYAATYDKGLMVFKNGKFQKIYNHETDANCTLDKHLLLNNIYVTDFDFDSKNNMWLANTGADKMLSVWKNDGTWQSYNIGNHDISSLMVDKNDIKWICKRGGELIVFKDGIFKTVNKSENTGHLPGEANCFTTDNNGTVWVGTIDGVALFYNSKKIFNSSSYSCSRILIPRNDGSGQADYLLSGLSVLSIAVDGANNLWFGTNNGVIQTSNDGQTTYHHFTMENSPLFSNTVKDIAIDDNGIVYFATDKGIISYRGTATKGNTTNSNVIVYPNPVRPEHSGVVSIKGLVTNALVKITTTNGAFVTHLQAEGGQAVWDRTDINGNTVQPGIYLIFVSDETGKETFATKVLIMK